MEKLAFSEANFQKIIAFNQAHREQLKIAQQEIVFLKIRIAELEARLNQNSSNSSKPPSSDGYKKRIVNLRTKSGKNPGGQLGHQGTTLEMTSTPDQIYIHEPREEVCAECGKNNWEKLPDEMGQVKDIPIIKPVVYEHRKQRYKCTCCGHIKTGRFPNGVSVNKMRYGEHVFTLAVYFNQYHFIPFERLAQVFSTVYSIDLSQGTLVNFAKRMPNYLVNFEKATREFLLEEPVLHADETGVRCQGKTQWVHVLSNSKASYFQLQEKRGLEAMEEIGLLPFYSGTLIHDRFASYLHFEIMKHGLCNAHILRELKGVSEIENCAWVPALTALLLDAKESKEKNIEWSTRKIHQIEKEFEHVVNLALEKEEKVWESTPKEVQRGRPKRSKAHNLLLAFKEHQSKFLAFMKDPNVPFDNNQAERDLRMIKTKQKISGCFRSKQLGEAFCLIRSFISTLVKNNIDVLQGIQDAYKCHAFIRSD